MDYRDNKTTEITHKTCLIDICRIRKKEITWCWSSLESQKLELTSPMLKAFSH